jgi:prepilin-type N-terminal cleavage/methylation domain-containing protein
VSRLWARSKHQGLDDQGFTLVELLATAALFSVFLLIFGAAVDVMYKDVRKQQGSSDGLDANRKAVQLLDKQIRYANAVTNPGLGTDGNPYVEWRSGNTGQSQTCTQWRLNQTTHFLQWRTWTVPNTTASAWRNQANNIYLPTVGSLFSLNPAPWSSTTAYRVGPPASLVSLSGTTYVAIADSTGAIPASSPASWQAVSNPKHQTLEMAFLAKAGRPTTNQSSDVSLSARNADLSKVTFNNVGICNEVARS